MKYSEDGKTVMLDDGRTILTYEGHKALDAAMAKEAAKGNPRFIEGSPALKWKTERFGFHFPPVVGQVQLERERNIRRSAQRPPQRGSNWVK